MSEPKGEVVARPLVTRACGCVEPFAVYSRDKYVDQRKARFAATRCQACVQKLQDAQRAAAAAVPGAGEALDALPAGAQVVLTRRADGKWGGTLTAGGRSVDGEGDGARGLVVALARRWVSAGAPGG